MIDAGRLTVMVLDQRIKKVVCSSIVCLPNNTNQAQAIELNIMETSRSDSDSALFKFHVTLTCGSSTIFPFW